MESHHIQLGLTSAQARQQLDKYGFNRIAEKKRNSLQKFAHWAASPISLMLLAAAILSLTLDKIFDVWLILTLYALNFFIQLWHEHKADQAVEKLESNLSAQIRTCRDGRWQQIDSSQLVPGDVISLFAGSVVPADVHILDSRNVSINESAVTGESLPKEKNNGDYAFTGTFVATGQAVAEVVATGMRTRFGKTIKLVDNSSKKSLLEQDILNISKFLSTISIAIVAIFSILFLALHQSIRDVVTVDLSLLIAGIPVALPTVMSIIIGIGILELAKKQAVVRRLSSLEDLANVNLLLSDKTGTLTQNEIQVAKVIPYGKLSQKDLVALASSTTGDDDRNPIDNAVKNQAKNLGLPAMPQLKYIPADSQRKRATAVTLLNNNRILVSAGAVQVIESLCELSEQAKKRLDDDITEAAVSGYRLHAIAIKKDEDEEKGMVFAGLLLLSDTIRPEAKEVIDFLRQQGVNVKMVTGDNHLIAQRVASELGLEGKILTSEEIARFKLDSPAQLKNIAGFAEVLPEDKLRLAQEAENFYTVAMTGDGINDLPAIKAAGVGVAVKNAVDALRTTADIVLLSDGITVIKDAIVESRKIFARLYHYSVFRLSESFRIIITIAVLGFIYHTYPLTPIHLLLLAFLNDVPIVSLAYDRVRVPRQPAKINIKQRFVLSTLYGMAGIANSLLMFFLLKDLLHIDWVMIQTVFFLKLVVSGHLLIYVAHTDERWWRMLPSKQVIGATLFTQLLATAFALFGWFTQKISWEMVLLVWVWSFIWMQVSELAKIVRGIGKTYQNS